MEKLKHESHLKTPIPMNWSTSPGPFDRLGNVFHFFIFVYFLIFFILPLPFSIEIPNL